MSELKVGWIGLGNMGVPMAKNVAARGISVKVFNRTSKDVELGQCVVSVSPEEAVQDADIVCIMVSDAAAVKDVLFGRLAVARSLKRGALVVNFSTIGVDESKQLALDAAESGFEWMDAPVSGSVGPAESGNLVVLAGGSEGAFTKARPVFDAVSKEAFHLGPVGSGSAMKLLVNAYLGAVVEASSECLAVADKVGLGREQTLEVFRQTAMWAPILAAKEPLWKDNNFPSAFALKHMAKDLGLMVNFARSVTASTPTLSSVAQVYLSAMANDLAEQDMAAVFRETSRLAGSNE